MGRIKLFLEFVENSYNIIDATLNELKDLVDGITGNGREIMYHWEKNGDIGVVIVLSIGDVEKKWDYDVDQGIIEVSAGEWMDQIRVKTVDEGLDYIVRDVHNLLGVDEAKSQKYKGHKIPGKYLTENPGKMKREIETFRGKKIYKKDWDADYKSGKGGEGERVKTKKSAATKAYQKMFGDKK